MSGNSRQHKEQVMFNRTIIFAVALLSSLSFASVPASAVGGFGIGLVVATPPAATPHHLAAQKTKRRTKVSGKSQMDKIIFPLPPRRRR